jgi:hypothetical protein
MKKIWLALILVVVVAGCAPSGKWIRDVNYKAIDLAPGGYLKSYILGQSKTAFIGQEIIGVAKCDSFQKAVSTNQIVSITGRDRYVKEQKYISRGTFPITGTVALEGKTFYVMNPGGVEWGVLISNSGDIYNNALYGYNYQLVYVSDSISISPDKYEYSTTCIRQSKSSISFELIYAGKNDISLNATYKEFSVDDLARPAFFQNITYQADAKQIRFKDFAIRIEDVSNEKITYTVLEDGLK